MKSRSKCTPEEIGMWRRGEIVIIIPCLKCGQDFESTGSNNRVCKSCWASNKNTASAYSESAVRENIGW